VIRNKLKLSPSTAIFMFFGNNLPYQTQKMSDVYENYRSEDGFLRATISNENTFG
jgi:GABA(A) receptor-associated protein